MGALADLAHPPIILPGHLWMMLMSLSDKCNDEASFQSLLQSTLDMRSKALALSSALPHAGDWLNAIHSYALGLHIPNRLLAIH